MNLLSARPQHDIFGINNAMLVAPGAPERSVLLHRLARRGRGQMPPLVTNRIDEGAVRLFRDWIASLKPELPFVRAWEMGDFLPDLDGLKSRQPKEDAVDRRKSDVSNMPAGIVNVLQKEQVLDLLVYLLSDPKPKKAVSR